MESINVVGCIKGEIHSIMTLIRLNTRWATRSRFSGSSSKRDKEDQILMQSFRRLNAYLEGIDDVHTLDCVAYLRPFHQVIISEHASGALTNAALSALSKFALYGFLSREFPRAQDGIDILSECISKCVFEESDWQSDEVVMLKLLELSTMSFRCDAATHMSAKAAWNIFDTCLSIRNQQRVSSILKSEAETSLRHLTLTSFSRAHAALKTFELEAHHLRNDGGGGGSSSSSGSDMGFSDRVRGLSYEEASAKNVISSPVGLTLLLGKIMTVLAGQMNADESSSSDGSRQRFSLQLVNVALEAGGAALGAMGPLVDVLRGDVCRHLLRATQSEDLATFSVALRVVFNLFMSIKDHMKTQLEVFLTSVHIRLLTTNKVFKDKQAAELHSARQELALESLLEFCREPALMQDLYTNYDCDVQCTNLFDAIIKVLCARALPKGESWDPTILQADVMTQQNPAGLGYDGSPSSSTMQTAFNSLERAVLSKRESCQVELLNELAFDGMLAVLHNFVSRLPSRELTTEGSGMYERTTSASRIPSLGMDGGGGDTRWAAVDAWCDRGEYVGDGGGDEEGSEVSGLWPDAADVMTTGSHDTHDADVFLGTEEREYESGSMVEAEGKGPETVLARTASGLSDSSSVVNERDGEMGDSFLARARARTADVLRQRKLKKERLQNVAAMFNKSPNKMGWVRQAVEYGLFSAYTRISGDEITVASSVSGNTTLATEASAAAFPADPKSVALFVKQTQGLGFVEKGEFLSKGPAEKYPFQAAVLDHYLDSFDFCAPDGSLLSFADALRNFLSHFRLPGEAQCIDRIMDAFASRIFTVLGPGNPFKTRDGAFVLAFSTIMLNTDLHNPNISESKKMTLKEFTRNNRGIDDGADVPRSFLETLYRDIKSREIAMNMELVDGPGGLGLAALELEQGGTSAQAWNNLLRKSALDQAPAAFTPTLATRGGRGGRRSLTASLSVHEKDMFLVMAEPMLRATLTLLEIADDDQLLVKTIDATLDYASACARLGLPQVLDQLVRLVVLKCHAMLLPQDDGPTGADGASGHVDASMPAAVEGVSGGRGQGLDLPERSLAVLDADPLKLFDRAALCSRHQNLPESPRESTTNELSGVDARASSSPAHLLDCGEENNGVRDALCAVRGEVLSKAVYFMMYTFPESIDVESYKALLAFLDAAKRARALPTAVSSLDDVSTDRDFVFRSPSWAPSGSVADQGEASDTPDGGGGSLLWGILSAFSSGTDASADRGSHVGYGRAQSAHYSVLRRCLAGSQWERLLFTSPAAAAVLLGTVAMGDVDSILKQMAKKCALAVESQGRCHSGTCTSFDEESAVLRLEWIYRIAMSRLRRASTTPEVQSALHQWRSVKDWLSQVIDRHGALLRRHLPLMLERVVFVVVRAAFILPILATKLGSGGVFDVGPSLATSMEHLDAVTNTYVSSASQNGSSMGDETHLHLSHKGLWDSVWDTLALLPMFPSEIFTELGDRVAVSLFYLIRDLLCPPVVSAGVSLSLQQWHLLFSLLSSCTACPSARAYVWTSVYIIVSHCPDPMMTDPETNVVKGASDTSGRGGGDRTYAAAVEPANLSLARQLLLRYVHGIFVKYPAAGGTSESPSTVEKGAEVELSPVRDETTVIADAEGKSSDGDSVKSQQYMLGSLYCLTKLALVGVASYQLGSDPHKARERVCIPMRAGLSNIRAAVASSLVPLTKPPPRSFSRVLGSWTAAPGPTVATSPPRTALGASAASAGSIRASGGNGRLSNVLEDSPPRGDISSRCGVDHPPYDPFSSLEPLSGPHVMIVAPFRVTATPPPGEPATHWIETVKILCDIAGCSDASLASSALSCLETLIVAGGGMLVSSKVVTLHDAERVGSTHATLIRGMREVCVRLPLCVAVPHDAAVTSIKPDAGSMTLLLQEAGQLLQANVSVQTSLSVVQKAQATVAEVLIALYPSSSNRRPFATVWLAVVCALCRHATHFLSADAAHLGVSQQYVHGVVEEAVQLLASLLRLLRASARESTTETEHANHAPSPTRGDDGKEMELLRATWVALGGKVDGGVNEPTLIDALTSENEKMVGEVRAMLASHSAPNPRVGLTFDGSGSESERDFESDPDSDISFKYPTPVADRKPPSISSPELTLSSQTPQTPPGREFHLSPAAASDAQSYARAQALAQVGMAAELSAQMEPADAEVGAVPLLIEASEGERSSALLQSALGVGNSADEGSTSDASLTSPMASPQPSPPRSQQHQHHQQHQHQDSGAPLPAAVLFPDVSFPPGPMPEPSAMAQSFPKLPPAPTHPGIAVVDTTKAGVRADQSERAATREELIKPKKANATRNFFASLFSFEDPTEGGNDVTTV